MSAHSEKDVKEKDMCWGSVVNTVGKIAGATYLSSAHSHLEHAIMPVVVFLLLCVNRQSQVVEEVEDSSSNNFTFTHRHLGHSLTYITVQSVVADEGIRTIHFQSKRRPPATGSSQVI